MEYEYHELANIFPLIEGKEFDELVEDIASNGQLEAIILVDGLILDGRNRYRACLEAGLTPRFEDYEGATNAAALLSVVMSYNMHRRHLNSNQLAFIALNVLPHLEAEAKERQGRRTDLTSDSELSEVKRPIQAAADLMKTNRQYVQDAKKIAVDRPEEAEAIKRGETTIPKVMKEIKKEARRAERVERIQEISAGNEALDLSKTYPVIYADPPWQYDTATPNRAIENHYATMAIDDICALPINEIASPDACLFMWVTGPMLYKAMKVLDAWGFEYYNNFVWVKRQLGMGWVFRSRHELLIYAVRGAMPKPLPASRPASVYESDRLGHSEKPHIMYDYIEAMYPEYDKIELFARNPRPGWDRWGNQS